MTLYHYNEATGKSGVCRAKIKCPLGENTQHFNNKNELHEYIQSFEENKSKIQMLKEQFRNIKNNNYGSDSKLVSFYSSSDEIASGEFDNLEKFSKINSLEGLNKNDAVIMRYIPFAELMEGGG